MLSSKMDMRKASQMGSAIALATAGYLAALVSPASAATKQEVPFAVPPGITFIEATVGGGMYSLQDRGMQKKQGPALRYANEAGMVLYTSDKDAQGKSNCDAECAKTWVAVVAPAGANATGYWSIAHGADGQRQWAFKGKPVYTYVNDKKPAEAKGTTVDGGTWRTISVNGADGIPTPAAIAVREVDDAVGFCLVDSEERPLYLLEGKLGRGDKPLSADWEPVHAPMIANPVGSFTIIKMDDGTDQWAYKGKPLYTFKGDLRTGDAKGIGVDQRLQVALVARYFMPSDIVIRKNLSRGTILANKATGVALYKREGYQPRVGGHFARATNHGTPSVGRSIGVSQCDAKCLETWRPVVAPAGAQAQDYWTILTRPDGTKQWAYRGYALYSFTGDQAPGDMKGDNQFTYLTNLTPNSANDPSLPSAVYWKVVFP